MTVSRYGNLKLGPDDEKPRYSDGAWFSMLFTTGLGIGFFFYGVSEPLYYYRQPRSWSDTAAGSDVHKPGYDDDDQKANQAIFITLYHWGLHGWIPYLVPTVLLGLVSHRWGLPMTVRSCFYPLVGNHVFSTLGDVIDALSIACTTFGVCTSLVLGAGQVVAFCNRIYLGPRRFASGADGAAKWPPSFCPFPEGGDEALGIAPTECGLQTFQQLVIWSITAVATASVILGLDAGLKAISFVAMSLAMMCFMLPFVSDNTWFVLNTFVQQVGYYFQNIVQVGFDCEAFQQLGVEFRLGGNHLWGQSTGAFNLMERLKESGVNNGSYVATTGPDCGAEKNPCFVGSIVPAIAAMSSAYLTSAGLSAADAMKAFALSTAYPNATAIPCGSGFAHNDTHVDAATATLGLPLGEPLPEGLRDYEFPRCPTSTYATTASWGGCVAFEHTCHAQTAFFQSSDTNFMNSWTIFYWGWWISWAPFFGIFVGQISRGRTIREVVLGAFVVPFFISCFWFSTFGALGIKMERVAEIALQVLLPLPQPLQVLLPLPVGAYTPLLALQVKPDWLHGSVDCSEHYDGDGAPLSAGARALSTIGYTMLSCMPWDNQILDVVEPYMWAGFWHVLGLVTLLLWYVTSSDSGSYADELLASSGLASLVTMAVLAAPAPQIQPRGHCLPAGGRPKLTVSLRLTIQALAPAGAAEDLLVLHRGCARVGHTLDGRQRAPRHPGRRDRRGAAADVRAVRHVRGAGARRQVRGRRRGAAAVDEVQHAALRLCGGLPPPRGLALRAGRPPPRARPRPAVPVLRHLRRGQGVRPVGPRVGAQDGDTLHRQLLPFMGLPAGGGGRDRRLRLRLVLLLPLRPLPDGTPREHAPEVQRVGLRVRGLCHLPHDVAVGRRADAAPRAQRRRGRARVLRRHSRAQAQVRRQARARPRRSGHPAV